LIQISTVIEQLFVSRILAARGGDSTYYMQCVGLPSVEQEILPNKYYAFL
jgi:hypothetical protein